MYKNELLLLSSVKRFPFKPQYYYQITEYKTAHKQKVHSRWDTIGKVVEWVIKKESFLNFYYLF